MTAISASDNSQVIVRVTQGDTWTHTQSIHVNY